MSIEIKAGAIISVKAVQDEKALAWISLQFAIFTNDKLVHPEKALVDTTDTKGESNNVIPVHPSNAYFSIFSALGKDMVFKFVNMIYHIDRFA